MPKPSPSKPAAVKPLAALAPFPKDPAAEILKGLNETQKEAVLHGEGPLLIVAGAGTGKTTVITRRIAHLVAAKKAKPSEILALTFTEAAATEMETRVDLLVPYGFNDVQIQTFHAFGDKLLKTYAMELGLSPNFKVMSPAESAILLKDHLFKIPMAHFRPMGKPTQFVKSLLEVFSRARDEDVSPEEYRAWAEKNLAGAAGEAEREEAEKQLEIARAFARFEAAKREGDLVDFGDQVILALGLLRRFPSVLRKIRSRFRYVLVDEFQDTNYAQSELVQLIAGDRKNLTVVADDDQSIYKWRGACLSNVLGFLDAYPTARQIVLTDNYRSTQVILDAAYRLITNNNPERLEYRNKIDKRLKARTLEGPPVRTCPFETVEAEAEWIASRIAEETEKGRRKPGDFAILVRANDRSEPYLEALTSRNIPWVFSGDAGLYARPEIKFLVSVLRVVADPFDSVSLYHLAADAWAGLPAEDLVRLTHAASRTKRPLWEAFTHPDHEPDRASLSPEGSKALGRLVDEVRRYLELSKTLTTGQLLYTFLKDSGLLASLSKADSKADTERAENIAKFFEIAREFGRVAELDRTGGFVQHLDALLAANDQPSGGDLTDAESVRVLTVHKSKGLEFPVVFLPCLVEDGFPTRERADLCELPRALIRDILPEGDYHLQEERRLFYVAMTRAKEELFLTSPRFTGGKRPRKTSRFIPEALDVPRVAPAAAKSSPLAAIGRAAPPAPAPEREAALLDPSEPLVLRATALDDYETCPLKYKFAHVLKVPTQRFHAATYGTAVHQALQFYHERQLEKTPATITQALEVFKAHWVSEGFVSREHEEQRYNQGVDLITRTLKAYEAKPPAVRSVEENFKFKVGETTVIGRWDRIDDRAGEIVVVDYKTSDVRTQDKADKKAKDSSQLGVYALGYQDKHGRLPDAMELHFLESGLVGRTEPTEKSLNTVKNLIETSAEGIRARRFPAQPDYFTCGFCAYQSICPSAVRTTGGRI